MEIEETPETHEIEFAPVDMAKLNNALMELRKEAGPDFEAWFYDQLPDPLRLELEIL